VTRPDTRGDDHLLVVGYGNELRGDDSVGPKVIAALETLQLPGVRTLACHQLAPELAELVSLAGRVVFVDASVDEPREVRLRPLQPAESSRLLTHAADPRTLLALARDVFGRCPPAWWLTIPAVSLEFSEALSPPAAAGLKTALDRIRELADRRHDRRVTI
jgi:hydrogenase maturation protease